MPIINGQKMACEPCIRGHRSTRCDHAHSRVMVPVRKPGRPLQSPSKSLRGGPQCVTIAIPRQRKCECSRPRQPEMETSFSSLGSQLGMIIPGRADGTSENTFNIHHHLPARTQPISGAMLSETNRPTDSLLSTGNRRPSPYIPRSLHNEKTYRDLLSRHSPPVEGIDLSSATEPDQSARPSGMKGPRSTLRPTQDKACCCTGDNDYTPSSERLYATPDSSCYSADDDLSSHCYTSASSSITGNDILGINHHAAFNHGRYHKEAGNNFAQQQENGPRMARPSDYSLNGTVDGSISHASEAAVSPAGEPVILDQQLCANCLSQPVTILICPPSNGQAAPLNPLQWQRVTKEGGLVYVILRTNSDQGAQPTGTEAFDLALLQRPSTIHSGAPPTSFECNCGPTCQCIGCIAHPFNDAMQRYIRSACSTSGETLPRAGNQNNSQTDKLGGFSLNELPVPMRSFSTSTIVESDAESQIDDIIPADDFFFVDFLDLQAEEQLRSLHDHTFIDPDAINLEAASYGHKMP